MANTGREVREVRFPKLLPGREEREGGRPERSTPQRRSQPARRRKEKVGA